MTMRNLSWLDIYHLGGLEKCFKKFPRLYITFCIVLYGNFRKLFSLLNMHPHNSNTYKNMEYSVFTNNILVGIITNIVSIIIIIILWGTYRLIIKANNLEIPQPPHHHSLSSTLRLVDVNTSQEERINLKIESQSERPSHVQTPSTSHTGKQMPSNSDIPQVQREYIWRFKNSQEYQPIITWKESYGDWFQK